MVKKRGINKDINKDNTKNINFLSKLQSVLFYPGRFFSDLKEKDLRTSLIFFISVSLIFAVLDFFIGLKRYEFLEGLSNALIIPTLFIYLILLMIFVIIILYLESLFLYIFILLFKVKLEFNDAVRFKSYTSAPIVFAWIHPFFGILLASVWSIIIEIIGLSKYGRISLGKSALIILLPIFIILFLILLVIIFALALILSSPVGFLIKDFF